MNNYQIEQYSEKYKEKIITINSYIMKKIGLLKNKSILRIGDFRMSCVPYTISLSKCRLLLILSPREQTVITANIKAKTLLHLGFIHPNLEKEIPLFFRINILNFQQLNSRLNQCLLEAELITIPQDYKEILVEYFIKDESGREFYNDMKKNSLSFKAENLVRNNCRKTGKLRVSNNSGIDFRIIEMSARKLLIFADTDKKILDEAEGKLICELFIFNIPVFINAVRKDYTASKEVEGYFIISIEVEYSPPLVDVLDKILQTEKNTPDESSSESEEALPNEETKEKDKAVETNNTEDSDAEEVLIEEITPNEENQ